ncbi:L,D-transpeptidase [Allorhizocola rhizosphaerae]|uniref:L,D-transpeptidase n=1 Tax=Allorhizocola rhizosphaerae TaxID=1872709 RepID=UPI000E3C9654|nr:Ig-like domain-containing protein [Allorhizocola rhizosphaerae]
MKVLWVSAVLLVASCTTANAPQASTPAEPPAAAAAAATLVVTPADGTGDLPISTEIGIDGPADSVSLADEQGHAVAGRMRADGSAWVPDQPLRFDARYTATVKAHGGAAVTTTFHTMPPPANRVGTGMYLFDGEEYGVAMPVVVEFTSDVHDRAAVQHRLFVETVPHQPGVWHWTGPRQVTYRAENYWQPGTVIKVRAALDGTPFGDGAYGDTDRSATVHIAQSRVELFIDNATKHLTVQENGTPIRSMPVSLGKPGTPSSSGTMVIMEKKVQTVFDTTGEPGDQYRADISYAQRLTWGGEFIHAAPWSVADQGLNNVSHGCVNMSWGDAEWLFGVTHVGDPVTVTGTEAQLEPGNGFTAWNVPWSEYVKGSALPVR